MNTLGGFIVIRNGFRLDYTLQLSAESLLPHVQELVLCDSDSDDGTREFIQRWADREPKIKYVNYPWTKPQKQSHHWFVAWLNFAKSHLTTTHFLYLDGDEVLSDEPWLAERICLLTEDGRPRLFDRLNFWKDASHLIPFDECCGKKVSRFGPCAYEAVSDEPHHAGERPILDEAIYEDDIKVYHLGFLREKKAFYRKARAVLDQWFGRYDPRLESAEKEGKPMWEAECEWSDRLVPWQGYLPQPVKHWLSERGHWVEGMTPLSPRPTIEASPTVSIRPDDDAVHILHSGDFGDIVYMMAVAKAIGKVRIYFRDWHGTKPLVSRMHMIIPLLKSQAYVLEAKAHEGEDIHWNAFQFRSHVSRIATLASAHYYHYLGTGLKPIFERQAKGLERWMDAPASSDGHHRVVINKTSRYHNPEFPWSRIVEVYGRRILFVGSHEEYHAFQRAYGNVDYYPTETLFQVASLIAGCDLFIGNQSSALAIAEALKRPLIQETCNYRADCVYLRADAQHVYNGLCRLPSVDGSIDTSISRMKGNENLDMAPPGGWLWPGNGHPVVKALGSHHALKQMALLTEFRGKSKEYIRDALIEATYQRLPDWGSPNQHQEALGYAAIQEAKATPVNSRSRLLPPRSPSSVFH